MVLHKHSVDSLGQNRVDINSIRRQRHPQCCAGAASGANRMSLGLDPIVSSLFYSLSLIPHLKRPARGTAPSNREFTVLPFVSVLVTFCQETRADIEMTVSSFLAQTYPADRFEVLMAIEPNATSVLGL